MSISTLNPGTQYTITANTVFDGSGNTINLGIIYKKSLSVLMSKRIGLINATVENYTTMGMAGVAKYYVARRNISRDYTAGTEAPDEVSTRPVNVPLDYRKEVSYTYETLDLAQLGVKIEDGQGTVSGIMLQGWIDAKAKSVEAYLYAKLLKLSVATSLNTGAGAPAKITATLTATPTLDEYRNLWDTIASSIYSFMNKIKEEYIGLDFEDGALLAAPQLYSKLILATTNLGSDRAQAKLEQGMPSFTMIGGIKVIPAPFLGEQYAAGVLDKTEAFDFSGVNLIWVHKQALAFPMSMGQANVFVLPTNGNIHNFHKFMVNKDGGVALRPSAIQAFEITQSS